MKYNIYVYLEDVAINWLLRINEGLKVATELKVPHTLSTFFANGDRNLLIKKAFSTPSLYFYGIPLTNSTQQLIKGMNAEDYINYKIVMLSSEAESKLTWLKETFNIPKKDVVFIPSDLEITELIEENSIFILNEPELTKAITDANGYVAGSFNSTFTKEDTLWLLHKLNEYTTKKEPPCGNL